MQKDFEDNRGLAAVVHDLRRRMYLFVRGQDHAVTREETARELGISRKLAAFHLDKLVEAGLLVAHYARPPGRSGPGAGRSAKFYEPSEAEIEVSIPKRRYDLVGRLLVDAIKDERPGETALEAAIRVAGVAGLEVGEEVRRAIRLRRPGPERTLAVAGDALERYGFEPFHTPLGELKLRNCPFHTLARHAPDIVCEMNHAFIDGLLRGLGNDSVDAVLTREPGECCVTLRPPAPARRGMSPVAGRARRRDAPGS